MELVKIYSNWKKIMNMIRTKIRKIQVEKSSVTTDNYIDYGIKLYRKSKFCFQLHMKKKIRTIYKKKTSNCSFLLRYLMNEFL